MRPELRVQLEELRDAYPGLKYCNGPAGSTRLEGSLGFRIVDDDEVLTGTYLVRIDIPWSFPDRVPEVRELAGRVPAEFHKDPEGTLCLASPIDLKLNLLKNPSVKEFVDEFVVSYFLSFQTWEATGELPFGERSHGLNGIVEGLADWLGCAADMYVVRRLLNRLCFSGGQAGLCPCTSGESFRACHGRRLADIVEQLGGETARRLATSELAILEAAIRRRNPFLWDLMDRVATELSTSLKTQRPLDKGLTLPDRLSHSENGTGLRLTSGNS